MEQEDNAAAGLMDKVKVGAVSQLNAQKDRATGGLGSVAHAVRQTAQPLRDAQQETIAHYVEQAAGQIDRLSDALKRKNVEELAADAQQFARRNPAIFIGSAFALGLIAARFFKSSRERDANGSWRRGGSAREDGGYRSFGSMYGTVEAQPIGTTGIGKNTGGR